MQSMKMLGMVLLLSACGGSQNGPVETTGHEDNTPQTCKNACDCSGGQACVGGLCSATRTPVYCCDDALHCPTGSLCDTRAGQRPTCGAPTNSSGNNGSNGSNPNDPFGGLGSLFGDGGLGGIFGDGGLGGLFGDGGLGGLFGDGGLGGLLGDGGVP